VRCAIRRPCPPPGDVLCLPGPRGDIPFGVLGQSAPRLCSDRVLILVARPLAFLALYCARPPRAWTSREIAFRDGLQTGCAASLVGEVLAGLAAEHRHLRDVVSLAIT